MATAYRVVHYADMVPHNPPASFGFLHQGFEVWYQKGMTSHKVCSYGESSSCSNSLSIVKLNANDHSMSNYLQLPTDSLDIVLNYFLVFVDEVDQKINSLQENKDGDNLVVDK